MGHPASKQTLIEDETEFRGKLVSKCPVVVKGKVDGEIEGPSLNVSVTGSVTGKVKVGELRSEGTIGGEFDAETIHLAGTVKDKTVVKARSLEVKLQPQNGRLQVTFGECELNVGDVTTKEDAVSAAQRKDKAAEKPADKPAEKPAEKPEDSPTNIREAPAEAAEAGEAGGKTRGKTRRDTSSPTPA
jgi:cytoskeletal protein CcmA (bactofilin family)